MSDATRRAIARVRNSASVPTSNLTAMQSRALVLVGLAITVLAGCGGGSQATTPAPKVVSTPTTIIGTRAEGTAKELIAKGEAALLAQRWQDAVDAFEAALAGDPDVASNPQVLYDLAVAYEGLGEREKARARFREVVRRFPNDPNARNALAREVSLDAYLEDWAALGQAGDMILARTNLEPADRMLGLGARGLSRVEAKDENAASHDIQDGLDLVDEYRYGATGQLPVAAAMLKYAHGELRKLRSEKISLDPPGTDFVLKLEARCAGLLDAQNAYADAIRSIDPLWAAMSGYRVGEMYRQLHQELMRLPAPVTAKTESDKQLFYAIMHVRYRALLDKGIEMMKRTLGLGERTGTASAWMARAKDAKDEMERALEDEKVQLAKLPYTEAEVEKALEILKKKAQDQQARSSKGT